ncbi:YdbH domain-containing protein [Sphingomonas sp. LM7]|uniref:YdbH domain-containing protein n=1 Tax=Sphingomonas sp. LM7 TaxID=1938607 RepID=UPI0009839DF5|nr:YdbH domain-containing protein [Sphingomonas sp. LM7]AQR74534.1 hypothetical protein BXU08_13505 [Sphingomonas sp. LM7]
MTKLDQAPEEATVQAATLRARRPWGRLFLTLAALLLVALFAAWMQRRTIARGFVDQELSRRGVPAQYRIEQLSPWRQRLTDVVIGDPRNPDLTADWIELGTALSPWSARVLALRAGHVRVKGRIVDGRLSLGAIDKLMPAPSGKPFALPHVEIDVADARLRLDSGHGILDIWLKGRGMLDNGFAGTARIASTQLDLAGCSAFGVSGTLAVRIRDAQPSLVGPVAASRAHCADARAANPKLTIGATLGAALDRWRGAAELRVSAFGYGGRRVAGLGGNITFDGAFAGTRGRVALRSGRFESPELAGAALQLAGDYRQHRGGFDYRGTMATRSAALPGWLRNRIAGYGGSAQGTPLAPVAAQLARATAAAATAFDATADLSAGISNTGFQYSLPRLQIVSASGARLSFDRGSGIRGEGATLLPQIDGALALRGGGMPEALIRLSQKRGDAQLRGVGFVQPYVAGSAALALSRISFALGRGGGTIETLATISGPLANGRIERLSLPLDAHWRGAKIVLNRGCAIAGFERVAIAGVVLAPGRIRACPIGGAMVSLSPRGITGGVRLDRLDLTGRVGSSPLLLRAADARFLLDTQWFAVTRASVRLGVAPATRLDIESLTGGLSSRIAGTFAGLGGQIGSVPLVISGGAGSWQVSGTGLSLTGGLQVSDAATPPRFHPVSSGDARLELAGNVIVATAGLRSPAASIGSVEIRHDLGDGRGSALLHVPGLRFAEGGLQPSDLTPLTFGVIADVSGSVSGEGRIVWSPQGLSSTGRFSTDGVDLAAAFGPVRGLATELRFDDLLGMRTAPGQVATTVEINPGVPVRNGTIRFRLLDSQRVEVEGARWPFAGGELVLEPTILDFSQSRERRLTFRVIGADAAQFLKEMEFDNLDATGIFDGTLPMVFDEQGGRIEGGSLRARGGGSIAYVGELSQRDLGFWSNMAFQALKALDYRNLTLDMNGPLDGDMVTEIRFSGVSQGKGTKSNFLLRRLAKLPFVFNVRINAPFKQLLDSVQSWYDPNRLIERNLPTLLEQQERTGGATDAKPVQPSESDKLR